MQPLILNVPTIAITGSSGKTTTKEMIASVLETRWKVFKSQENRNQRYHTKQHAEMIKPHHQAVVLEFGMGRKNAGMKHCSYIQPNISVITNVGSAHFGMLGNSLDLTIESKSALIKYMKPEGLLLLNADDNNSKLLHTQEFKGEIVTIGISNNASYKALNVKYLDGGMGFDVKLNGTIENFFIPVLGLYNVSNALYAIAICHRLQFSAVEIRNGLQSYQAPEGRLNVLELRDKSIVLDDTFNANPEAVKAAVDVLLQIGKGKKKIVVLGSMLELGEYSLKGHKGIGKFLAKNKIDAILTYGKKAAWVGVSAAKTGHQGVMQFRDRDKLHEALEKVIEPGCIILVKGSNRMEMNKTVEYLRQKFS